MVPYSDASVTQADLPGPLGDGGRHNDDSGDNSKRSDNMLDNLKAYTSLEPKGKPIAQPGIVQSQPTSGETGTLGAAPATPTMPASREPATAAAEVEAAKLAPDQEENEWWANEA